MDLSRRGFLMGAGAITVGVVAADPVLSKVTLVQETPRQPIKLEGHTEWALVRPHVLGHLSLEEMAMGLPGPWQEFLASWWVEGPKVHMPVVTRHEPRDRQDIPENFLGAKLNSGFMLELSEKGWKPFYDKWNREVAVPLYGREIYTANLGPAILTNIHLFRLALKYHG